MSHPPIADPSCPKLDAAAQKADPFDDKRPLVFAVAELTNRCNLRCPHCASNSGRARDDELDAEEWARVFDDLAELGCLELTLLGGEIFLRPDWLELAQRASSAGLGLTVVTNGLLLRGENFDKLLSLPLVRVGVSLDGASSEVYRAVRGVDGFERVWSCIEGLRDDGRAPVSAITTYSATNLGDVQNLANLIVDSGVTWQNQIAGRVSTRFDEDSFITRDQFHSLCLELAEQALAHEDQVVLMDDFGYFPLDSRLAPAFDWWGGCEAGRSVIGIRSNGDVLGCLSLGDPFIEANLRERSLIDIWRAPESFATMRNKENLLQGACRTCPEATRCRAGCAAMAYSATGSILDNPYCLRRLECEDVIARLY